MALPEVTEAQTFGAPVFRAGKKTFSQFSCYGGVPKAGFWVGKDRQVSLTLDDRYEIPAYMGHNGWINLRLDKRFDGEEVARLALESYKHFALKRMLGRLNGDRSA